MEVPVVVAYIVLIIGSALDQIITRICLAYPPLSEADLFIRWLQANGLWLVFDACSFTLLFLPLSILLKEKKAKELWTLLLIPMVVGFLRMKLGALNFILI